MSRFEFIASDKMLDEIKNPYIEIISYREAIERKIIVHSIYEINLDMECLVCDSDEHLYEITITHNMYYPEVYSKKVSNKQYFAQLQWYYTEERAKQLIEYVREQLKVVDEIELWCLWLDEDVESVTKTVFIDNLCIKDLEYLYKLNDFERPMGLIIKNP